MVGTGSGITADFNTVNIPADTTVNLNSARTIGNLIFGDTDSSGASWTLANNGVAGNKLILAGTTPTVTVNNLGTTGKATISAVVDGTAGLTKSGVGTLALTGANTYSGGTVINNSTLIINTDGALGAVPGSATPGNITLNGGTLQTTAANLSISDKRGISIESGGGTIANSGGGTLTYVGIIAGPGALTLNSPLASSAITLNAQSTHSGGTIINGPASASVLCLTSSLGPAGSPTSGPFGKGSITWNGPSTRSTTGSPVTIANAIIFAADTTFLNASGEQTLYFTGPVTLSGGNRTLTVNIGASVSGKSLTLSGAIGDGGNNHGLTKAGTGNLVLSGANTYGGATIVNTGTLILGASNVLPDASPVSIGSGTLDAATSTDTAGTLAATGAATINLGAGAKLAFADSSAINWTGGTLHLTGTLVFGGPNGSLRFGTTSSGLTAAQLLQITATGYGPFGLDADGYLIQAGYATWQSANGTTQTMDLDHDSDGVPNGIEYFLKGSANSTGFTALPGVTDTAGTLSVTWTKAASYLGTYGTDFVVETSSTLTGNWATEIADPNPGFTVTFPSATEVKYTFPAGTRNFVRLKVTGP